MEITEVRVIPVEEDKLKAFVSVVFDNCFIISDIKIIDGNNGRFISMPSKKRKNGTFKDIAHPLNTETRQMIEDKVFSKYEEVMNEKGPKNRKQAEEGEGEGGSEQSKSSFELSAEKYLSR